MKYLYKIHSGFDGFTPKKIPDRMLHGTSLCLGWKKYLDVVDDGDEVWVYFHGPHSFHNGVYVRGLVENIDAGQLEVTLRVIAYRTDDPLTDASLSAELARAVAVRYQQVFVLPEAVEARPVCDMQSAATSCRTHQCGSCRTWERLPLVGPRSHHSPPRMTDCQIETFAPAYWVIPSRCFLYHLHEQGQQIRPEIRRTSEMFYRFKVGEESLSFPLALGMQRALAKAHRLDFDAIVPVPLSPEKAAAGELHRTRALARELSELLEVPVKEWLTLEEPVSKRNLRTRLNYSAGEFEEAYAAQLKTSNRCKSASSVLLVDDVCTEGSTLKVCAAAIKSQAPNCLITASTAGQMAVKAVVANPYSLLS